MLTQRTPLRLHPGPVGLLVLGPDTAETPGAEQRIRVSVSAEEGAEPEVVVIEVRGVTELLPGRYFRVSGLREFGTFGLCVSLDEVLPPA
jgi:hypothetical protein